MSSLSSFLPKSYKSKAAKDEAKKGDESPKAAEFFPKSFGKKSVVVKPTLKTKKKVARDEFGQKIDFVVEKVNETLFSFFFACVSLGSS
jgi:hypothetical protein